MLILICASSFCDFIAPYFKTASFGFLVGVICCKVFFCLQRVEAAIQIASKDSAIEKIYAWRDDEVLPWPRDVRRI